MTSDWVMRLHADVWRPYIGARAARDVIERWSGSYAIKDAKTGVRIININTNYAYSANFWLYDSVRASAAMIGLSASRTDGSPIRTASSPGSRGSCRTPRMRATEPMSSVRRPT